jgi:transposase InsO family protein
MPWRECTVVSRRQEFVSLALSGRTRMSALSQIYGVSRKTGYKWLARYQENGLEGLKDRSHRPLSSPRKTGPELEAKVCELRAERPVWGGRKLQRILLEAGEANVPSPSTITDILRRNGLLSPDRRLHRDWQRFEAESPNDLWQMDFKGHFALTSGRCHPLTLLDDHSRFNLCLAACGNETAETVKSQLERVFALYGLPWVILMDNGSPWGSSQAHSHTRLTAWLIRLGVSVSHGRPYHPQTQGKEERFHRTLKLELLSRHPGWADLAGAQASFDAYRDDYNLVRPHQALGYDVPASRYQPSTRALQAVRPFEYEPGDEKRKVQDKGVISFKGRELLIGRAFVGETVALRALEEGVWDVYYCHQNVDRVDLRTPAGPDV